MKRVFALLLCTVLLPAAVMGCTGTPAEPVPEPQPEPPVELLPCSDFSPASAFGLELFKHALDTQDENPVLSPASAYLCLAMVMNGAGTHTLEEFQTLLGGDVQAVDSLSAALHERLTDAKGSTILRIANSLWADDDRVTIEESFLKALGEYFSPELYTADLPSQAALDAINSWVNEKTNGLIPTLHDKPYPKNTDLILLNTLYMKAKWRQPFQGGMTWDGTFTKADGTKETVPFMHASEETLQYIHTDGAEGILLPYDDQKTAFAALRPTDGKTAREFAAALTAERLSAFAASAQDTFLNLSMPKFELSYALYLTDVLKSMGLVSAFDPDAADLTKMGTGAAGPLYLNWVFQKIKIEVNEEGTEAAAVTEAVASDEGASAERPTELNLNSPFVYAVLDLETGVPLFIGLLDNPA